MSIKIGVICPTRGDRPVFMEQFHRMLSRQTLQPDVVEIVDYSAISDECDITRRYITGYHRLRKLGLDVIVILEDDDFYGIGRAHV